MRRLIIRPGAIGDCIVALPALEHLVTDYTEIWVPQAVVPLIQFGDKVRSISSSGLELFAVGDLPPSPNLVATLGRFDHIVSWYGSNRPEFREALSALTVRCEFHRALPPPDYQDYAGNFFAAQVGAARDLLPRIRTVAPVARQTVVIQPFSGSARKNWPLDSFRQLAHLLELAVDWSAGPEEALPNAARFENLADLANWMSGARLYIGNDSGITHLAAAIEIPTLALFGPTSPEVWAPRGQNVAVLRAQPIATLSVETVLEAANRLLGSR